MAVDKSLNQAPMALTAEQQEILHVLVEEGLSYEEALEEASMDGWIRIPGFPFATHKES